MLNLQQKKFCIEYLKDFNATRAAKRSFYSSRSAYNIGSRLMKNDEVRDFIEKLLAEQNPIYLLHYLYEVLRSDETTKVKLQVCEHIIDIHNRGKR